MSLLDYLPKDHKPTNSKLAQKLDNHFVDVNEKLPFPPVAISIGEHTIRGNKYPTAFGTYGNFSAIVGPSKSKKTFLKSLLISRYIGGASNQFSTSIKGHNTKLVVDIDTEQSLWHSQNVFKRVTEMVGSTQNYKPYSLRSLSHQERLELIEFIIYESDFRDEIGVMAIDGIADLIQDFNNLVECEMVVQKLMKWTAEKNIHIITIIHQNSTTNKATGHLGSFILKKAETVCNVKNVEESVNVTFNHTRGYPIPEFQFQINADGYPYVLGEQLSIIEEKSIIQPNMNFETDPF